VKPRIGITYTYGPGEAGHINDNVREYVVSVEAVGGEAVLLRNEVDRIEESLAWIDGLILSGGRDIDPKHYGAARHPKTTQPANEPRDLFELALVRAARAREMPTLCICRGLQVANVAFGGTLIQDLASEMDERYTLHHQQVKEDGEERTTAVLEHAIDVEPDSALARLLGATRFPTNSMHHQAVKDVAPSLRSVARTPDGVVEALDAGFEHPFFYAVQWHPEELHDDPISVKLFGGLVEASRRVSGAVERI
jgi:putative glutamine amidotransferase